jgi:predicted CoA-substrate-specific enzyme activase
MITAGIDIGHQSVNAVILENDTILTHISRVIAGGVEAAAQTVYLKALDRVGLDSAGVERVFATGVGREKVTFADGNHTEMLSHVQGAHWLYPAARTVIDVGAEGSRILRCDARGNLTNFVMNDKCASGAGVFLETVAAMMQISLPELGPCSLEASKKVVLTTTCAVFAESEIVAEIHRGSAKADILAGVHASVAARIAAVIKRIGIEAQLVFSGGVALNIGLARALEKQLELEIQVPPHPDIIGALGAAVLAGKYA